MKKILYVAFMLIFSSSLFYAQEIKTVQIYSNGMTHDNIKANITYNENGEIVKDDFFYTVTTAAMWTGKLSTIVAYNGTYDQLYTFLSDVLRFANENKDNMDATTTIENRVISRKKVAGVKCVVIKNGDEATNTNIKSLTKALESLDKWKKKNEK